ncbi:MAG: hypothetical protein ABIG28_00525 [archaeon]
MANNNRSELCEDLRKIDSVYVNPKSDGHRGELRVGDGVMRICFEKKLAVLEKRSDGARRERVMC